MDGWVEKKWFIDILHDIHSFLLHIPYYIGKFLLIKKCFKWLWLTVILFREILLLVEKWITVIAYELFTKYPMEFRLNQTALNHLYLNFNFLSTKNLQVDILSMSRNPQSSRQFLFDYFVRFCYQNCGNQHRL